jgi:outer membrane protein/protease secretion system outer membrane protein
VSAIRKLTRFVPAIGLALATAPAGAIDLIKPTKRALSQDAAFQAATRADTEARRGRAPGPRPADAQHLQQPLSQQGQHRSACDQRLGNPVKQSYDYFSSNYGISLRQPLFRKYNFALYRQAVRRGKRRSQSRQEPAGSRRAHGRRLLRGPDGQAQYALIIAQKDAYGFQLEAAKQASPRARAPSSTWTTPRPATT